MAAVLLAGVLAAAFGGELAAGVLPALPGIIPVEANLGEASADSLGGLLGEGDPNPLADNLGEIVGRRIPPLKVREHLGHGQSAAALALGVVDVRQDAGVLLHRFRFHRFRCSVLTDRVREPLLVFLCIFGFHAFFLHWLTALRSLAPRPEAHRQGAARGSDLQRAPRFGPPCHFRGPEGRESGERTAVLRSAKTGHERPN